MSTGYDINGTHAADFLSTNVSETFTYGNTGLAATLRIYDCNAPLNGYLLTASNGIFTINEANNAIPTRIGIGTTTPLNNATLQVQGTIFTSNIGTYNTNNTLYFNNSSLASISNITTIGNLTALGTCNVIGSGMSYLTLGNNTGPQSITFADVPGYQWQIRTSNGDLHFFADYPVANQFTVSRFHINRNGEVGTALNKFDDGNGNFTIAGAFTLAGGITLNGAGIFSNIGSLTSGSLNVSGNTTIQGTLNAQNIICGSNSSNLSINANALNINMSNLTYTVYTCSTNSNIQTVNVSNDIMGSQSVVYISATSNISIYGYDRPLGGTNIKSSYTTLSVGSNSKAILTVTSDGITRYVNCATYL